MSINTYDPNTLHIEQSPTDIIKTNNRRISNLQEKNNYVTTCEISVY